MQNNESEKSFQDESGNRNEGLIRFTSISFGAMIHNLEKWAISLRAYSAQEGHMVDGTRIPEYQAAKNALEQYKDALIARIKNDYRK